MSMLWVWSLLAVGLPLTAAFLHRRRRQPAPVPSILLLRLLAPSTSSRHRGAGRLRHRPSLLLMLGALVTLVGALALREEETLRTLETVVILDTSASMGTRSADDGRTRLEQAHALVRDHLGEREAGDRVALITTGEHTKLASGFTQDFGSVLAKIARLQAHGGNKPLREAIALAEAMVARSPEARLVVVTDGVGTSVPSSTRPMQVLAVGDEGQNVGISSLALRDADALGLAEVYLSLTSHLEDATSVEIELRVDDRVVDVIALDVPAKGRVDDLHRTALVEGARISAHLRPPPGDVLAADDVAFVDRDAKARAKVLLVSGAQRSFASRALELHPNIDLKVVHPGEALPDAKAAWDLVVLETRPPTPLPKAARVVAFGVAPGTFGVRPGTRLEHPEIIRWSYDHPLFRYVDLQDLTLEKATVLKAPPKTPALIDAEQGPIAVLVRDEDNARQVALFGFSLEHTDLALRVGFVNLMANAVEWALADAGSSTVTHTVPAVESTIVPTAAFERSAKMVTAAPESGFALRKLMLVLAFAFLACETLALLGAQVRPLIAKKLRRRPA